MRTNNKSEIRKPKSETSRKESEESRFWLRLVDTGNDAELEEEREELITEATELMKIFGSILQKSK
jgi:hypothetical protein